MSGPLLVPGGNWVPRAGDRPGGTTESLGPSGKCWGRAAGLGPWKAVSVCRRTWDLGPEPARLSPLVSLPGASIHFPFCFVHLSVCPEPSLSTVQGRPRAAVGAAARHGAVASKAVRGGLIADTLSSGPWSEISCWRRGSSKRVPWTPSRREVFPGVHRGDLLPGRAPRGFDRGSNVHAPSGPGVPGRGHAISRASAPPAERGCRWAPGGPAVCQFPLL